MIFSGKYSSGWFLLVMASALGANEASAGQVLCNETALKLATGSHPYRQIGERCEGKFGQEVGGRPLFVFSLTRGFSYEEVGITDTLLVEWHAPSGADSRIRVEANAPHVNYQMDTTQPGAQTEFEWPAGILVSSRMSRQDLGATASTEITIAGRAQTILLPLTIRPAHTRLSCASTNLQLWTGIKLSEVTVTLVPLDEEGSRREPILADDSLRYGYYPAEQLIEVPLSYSGSSVYYIKLTGYDVAGVAYPLESWIYDPSTSGKCGDEQGGG